MKFFRSFLLFICDSTILLIATLFCLFFSHWFHENLPGRLLYLAVHLVVMYACVTFAQLIFRTYASLWRYAESREYMTLLLAAFFGFLVYEIVARTLMSQVIISFITLTAIGGLWVLGMLLVRFAYRLYRNHMHYSQGNHQVSAAIVGAGSAGLQLLEELRSNRESKFRVECFFDDDPAKIHKSVHGVRVQGSIAQAPARLRALGIRTVFVAIPSVDEDRRHEILKSLSKLENIHISTLPSTMELIDRKPIRGQLREVQIEDLLGRPPIMMDPAPVDAFLEGKTVMVTGGGGSIGSELCRQIVKHDPRKLVIVDIYENNAYDIQQELLYRYNGRLDLSVEIASVRDLERVRQLMKQYRPDVVFHAAAHKHVPLMETSPQEAIRNNVFGTLNVVRAANEFKVEKFLLISTDKAVNPTSVMGASKRLCEMILQSMKGHSTTDYVAVRFGNVLGSNGSVVPLFKRQIAAGGPVTVTDKRIIRYFMTIPEAAQLVLQAGAQARKNELFVLNMGQPVKILDLAENLIRLSGLVPYRDIDIVETGLRPGEKLYEELLIASRDIEQTENSQIFIERQPAITPREMEQKLRLLRSALEENSPAAIRQALHEAVPTFHEPEEVNRIQGDEVQVPQQSSARKLSATV